MTQKITTPGAGTPSASCDATAARHALVHGDATATTWAAVVLVWVVVALALIRPTEKEP